MKTAILPALLVLCALSAQAQWDPAKRLTWTSGDSYGPKIAPDSYGHLHLVWYEFVAEDLEVLYKRSTDGGNTWSANKALTSNLTHSKEAAIAVDFMDAVHVVWCDNASDNYEIYHRKSMDGGLTWSTGKRLSWTDGASQSPVMAVDPWNRIHVVWEDNNSGHFELYYRGSADGGTTWSPAKRLTWNSGESFNPALAVDPNGDLHVVWYDGSLGNYRLLYKKSPDYGASWSANTPLSPILASSDVPSIMADGSGHLYAFWDGNAPGNFEVYFRKSEDGGATWSLARRLTWTTGDSWSPAAFADSSGVLHFAWDDITAGTPEIYYRQSGNGGATWSGAQRLTWNSGESWTPAVCVDSSFSVHLVWCDATPGNFEIFYRRQD